MSITSTPQEVALDMACTLHLSLCVPSNKAVLYSNSEWRHRIILPKPSAMFLPVYVHTQALCYYHSIRERPPCLQAKWRFQSLCFRTSTIFSGKKKRALERTELAQMWEGRRFCLFDFCYFWHRQPLRSPVSPRLCLGNNAVSHSTLIQTEWLTVLKRHTHMHTRTHSSWGKHCTSWVSGTELKALRWNVKFRWWYAQEWHGCLWPWFAPFLAHGHLLFWPNEM